MEQSIGNPQFKSRSIELGRKRSLKSIFLRWEWMLLVFLIIVNILNASISEDYFDYNNLASNMKIFLDKAIIALPMMMVFLIGEIDISVGSILTICGVGMGLVNELGAPFYLVVITGLAIGTLCGLINGLLVAKFSELSSTIVTLGTMILFRGIAYMILENRAYVNFPEGLQFFSWGSIWNIPFILVFYIIEVLIFAFVVHRTVFGRSLYAQGGNRTTSFFSGIKTEKIKIIVFTITGLITGIAAIFLLSKLGSARAKMAGGYEMEVIAMVVLGGVSSRGGKGTVLGVVISAFLIGFLRFGLGLINISSETIMIIIGALLIVAVGIPNLGRTFNENSIFNPIRKRFFDKHNEPPSQPDSVH